MNYFRNIFYNCLQFLGSFLDKKICARENQLIHFSPSLIERIIFEFNELPLADELFPEISFDTAYDIHLTLKRASNFWAVEHEISKINKREGEFKDQQIKNKMRLRDFLADCFFEEIFENCFPLEPGIFYTISQEYPRELYFEKFRCVQKISAFCYEIEVLSKDNKVCLFELRLWFDMQIKKSAEQFFVPPNVFLITKTNS